MRRASRLVVILLATAPLPASAQSAVCVKVKLEIPQRLSLERDAFEASLGLTNNLKDLPLENISVQIQFRDIAGARADSAFFVGAPALTNLAGALDGTGVVQPASRGDIRWLIIPTPGAGGSSLAGIQYDVRAVITYSVGAKPFSITTFDERITVLPQPELFLDYFLPRHVQSDDPFTAEIEPAIPFELAVRVSNIGAGPARNLRIATAQPKIVENKLGLLIDFKILGTFVGDQTIANTLALPFGTLEPGHCAAGAWAMTTSLSGSFVDLDVRFEHSEALGGAKTSLIKGVSKQWLVHRVLLEGPGRDTAPDLLADLSEGAGDGLPEKVFDSQCGELPVKVVAATANSAPTLEDPTALITADAQLGFIYFAVKDPAEVAGQKWQIRRVSRESDGKLLDLHNAWQFLDDARVPSLAVFDDSPVGSAPLQYRVRYDLSAMDSLPPVSKLQLLPPGVSADPMVVSTATLFLLAAVDDESGVQRKEYRVNGGAWTRPEGPFYFRNEGPLTLEYRAVDLNGNEEAPQSVKLLVDGSAPVITVDSPVPGRTYLQSERLPIQIKLTDADPAAHYTARLVPTGAGTALDISGAEIDLALVPAGIWTLEVRASDWLGHERVVKTGAFSVQQVIGGCIQVPEGGPCDDGLVCTVGDHCVSGACLGSPKVCDDGNVCSDDSCDPGSGCRFVPNTIACDDGSACTEKDICAQGECHGTPIACSDGNLCTEDSCDPASGCRFTPNTLACDDGSACTEKDTCAQSECHGTPVACSDGNVCTDDTCDPASGCHHAPNTASCDDGNPCTENDTCAQSECHGTPVVCSDGNVCTDDSCDPASGCTFAYNTAACDDGNPCTQGDLCASGVCQPGAPQPSGTVCSDRSPCTGPDRCDSAGHCVGTQVACSNSRTCDPATCCGETNVSCDDGDPCTEDFCNPESGCQHPPIPACTPDAGAGDAGLEDASGAGTDAGQPNVDAALEDAGQQAMDAAGGEDGGTQQGGQDASAADDAGAGSEEPPAGSNPAPGCGCRSAGGSSVLGVFFIAYGLQLRRRRSLGGTGGEPGR